MVILIFTAATHRFRIESTGGRYHVNPRPLPIYSGTISYPSYKKLWILISSSGTPFVLVCGNESDPWALNLQETIKKHVATLYLWPQSLEVPILDPSVYA